MVKEIKHQCQAQRIWYLVREDAGSIFVIEKKQISNGIQALNKTKFEAENTGSTLFI